MAHESVREFRRAKGWTQADLARELGLQRKASVSRLESGLRPFTMELALKLEILSNGALKARELVSAKKRDLLPASRPEARP